MSELKLRPPKVLALPQTQEKGAGKMPAVHKAGERRREILRLRPASAELRRGRKGARGFAQDDKLNQNRTRTKNKTRQRLPHETRCATTTTKERRRPDAGGTTARERGREHECNGYVEATYGGWRCGAGVGVPRWSGEGAAAFGIVERGAGADCVAAAFRLTVLHGIAHAVA